MTNADSCATINLAFAGVAHLVERDLAKVEVASSSLVARSKKNTPSDRMGYSFWKCAAAPVKSLPRPARSALNQEVRQDTDDPNVKETLRRSMYVVENGRHCLHVTYKRVLEKIRKSL